MIIELEELVKNGEIEIKTGPFGTQLKAAEYVESGTPVLNVKNLGYSTVVTTKVDYVGEKTLERLSMHILKEGDIVFGRKGSVDRHCLIRKGQDGCRGQIVYVYDLQMPLFILNLFRIIY